jgi:LPXTG-motif cell wall-anchored protein
VKLSSTLAAGGAVALIAIASVLTAGAANAAPGDTYVTASQLAPAAAPPQSGWSYETTTTAPVSTPAGLSLGAATQLHLGFGTAATGTTLVELAAGIATDQAVEERDVAFEIGFLGVPGDPSSYGTITSDATGIAAFDPASTWQTDLAPGAFTLAELDTLLDASSPGFLITDVGFGDTTGVPFTLSSFAANGVVYAFTPVPTATVTPATLTPAALGSTGVVATFTGFLPGEQVFAFFIPGTVATLDPALAVPIEGDFAADANGSVSIAYLAADAATAPGQYSIVAGSGAQVLEVPFTVAAAPVLAALPAAPGAPAELAATGTDPTMPVGFAGVLLATGCALAFAVRRRRI